MGSALYPKEVIFSLYSRFSMLESHVINDSSDCTSFPKLECSLRRSANSVLATPEKRLLLGCRKGATISHLKRGTAFLFPAKASAHFQNTVLRVPGVKGVRAYSGGLVLLLV